jgi:hypothetical protein
MNATALDWKRAREAAWRAGLSECLVTDEVVERYAALSRDVERTRGIRGEPMRPEERIAAAILLGMKR